MLGFGAIAQGSIADNPAVGATRYTLTCAAGSYSYTGIAATLTYASGAAGTAYTLTCAAGSYTYTGVATTALLHARSFSCAAGSYTYTGIATTSLKHARPLACAAGSYTYTGVATTALLHAHSLICAAGSYTYTGIAATLIKKTNYALSCAVGSYAYTGIATTSLKHNRPLLCATGSYAYTGVAANLTYSPGASATNYSMSCNTGTYAYTGIATTGFKLGHSLICAAGSYAYTGNAATLTYTHFIAPVAYTLSCDTGNYTYSSEYEDNGYVKAGYHTESNVLTRGFRVACATGSYAYTGSDATLIYEPGICLSLTRAQAKRLEGVLRLHGLIDPLVVSPTYRGDGTTVQSITGTSPATILTTANVATGNVTTSMLDDLSRYYALIAPMIEADANRTDGVLRQTVNTVGATTTVTRV